MKRRKAAALDFSLSLQLREANKPTIVQFSGDIKSYDCGDIYIISFLTTMAEQRCSTRKMATPRSDSNMLLPSHFLVDSPHICDRRAKERRSTFLLVYTRVTKMSTIDWMKQSIDLSKQTMVTEGWRWSIGCYASRFI